MKSNEVIFTKDQYDSVLADRHTRQVQDKLYQAHVAVCGLGGLGSNISLMLARAGVGHLHLIDFDEVELSNINRQAYFSYQVGQMKTDAIKDLILQINPYLDIRTDCRKISEENAMELFKEDSIICEAFDVPDQKAMLANIVLSHFPDRDYIAASGMAGFHDTNLIHTRQLSSHFYLCGDESSGATKGHGLMAPRVTCCASHEANQILQCILN